MCLISSFGLGKRISIPLLSNSRLLGEMMGQVLQTGPPPPALTSPHQTLGRTKPVWTLLQIVNTFVSCLGVLTDSSTKLLCMKSRPCECFSEQHFYLSIDLFFLIFKKYYSLFNTPMPPFFVGEEETKKAKRTISGGICFDICGLWTVNNIFYSSMSHKHLIKVILYALPSLLRVDNNF